MSTYPYSLSGSMRREQACDIAFSVLWLVVLLTSVIDGYLVLVNWQVIGDEELNPVGRFLLDLNGGRVWYLLAAKALGTILAASFVLVIYWSWRRAGLTIVAALALFQLGLLAFLCLA